MTDDEEPGGYELVMPFVTVTSRGGPHDDTSYTAGWECGAIDVRLALYAATGHPTWAATVHAANVPQLDLVAMKNGYQMRRLDQPPAPDLDRWAAVRFAPAEEPTP